MDAPSENSSGSTLHFRARWRWRQCTPLELQIVLRPARPARPVGSDQQVLQTVAKTYPIFTLRTPAAPFLPSIFPLLISSAWVEQKGSAVVRSVRLWMYELGAKEKLGLTVPEIAAKHGVSSSTVYQIL